MIYRPTLTHSRYKWAVIIISVVYGREKSGGGAMQVADLSQTYRTDIMNDDERWMGSDTSGTTLRFSCIRIQQISNLNTKVYTIRVRAQRLVRF